MLNVDVCVYNYSQFNLKPRRLCVIVVYEATYSNTCCVFHCCHLYTKPRVKTVIIILRYNYDLYFNFILLKLFLCC